MKFARPSEGGTSRLSRLDTLAAGSDEADRSRDGKIYAFGMLAVGSTPEEMNHFT